MLKVEIETDKKTWRVWSEEHNSYLLRESTIIAVTNFFRQQAIMRADMALKELVAEARKAGVLPPRNPLPVQ